MSLVYPYAFYETLFFIDTAVFSNSLDSTECQMILGFKMDRMEILGPTLSNRLLLLFEIVLNILSSQV